MAVFTFVPTFVELILVCGLLATKVSGLVAAVVAVTFAAYVVWTVQITTRAAESRKEVLSHYLLCSMDTKILMEGS